MKTCLIICGGEFSEDYKNEFQNADYVIAADSGFDNALKLKIKPNLVLGDFDSVKNDVKNSTDFEKITLPCEKDDTDTFFAAKLALEKGFNSILFCCALGGPRFDHALANIQTLLYVAKKGKSAICYGKNTKLRVLSSEYQNKICIKKDANNIFKQYFSIFALSVKVEGLCIKGAKYETFNGELVNSIPLGVSNEFKNEEVEISFSFGTILLAEVQEELLRR